MFEFIFGLMLVGLIPAWIAKSKGKNPFLWWIYGTLIFIVALPHALLMSKDVTALDRKAVADQSMKKCPNCAELVRNEAKVCRFCQYSFEANPIDPSPA